MMAILLARTSVTLNPALLRNRSTCAITPAPSQSKDALQRIAAMCAVVAGQSDFAQHSLLTGEENVKTLQLTSTDGTPLSTADAIAAVAHILPTFENERTADAIGKIRTAVDGQTVSLLASRLRCVNAGELGHVR